MAVPEGCNRSARSRTSPSSLDCTPAGPTGENAPEAPEPFAPPKPPKPSARAGRADPAPAGPGFQTRPEVPAPRDEPGFAEAADLGGVDLDGNAVALRVVGTDHDTLLAANPGVKFHNRQRGYIRCAVTRRNARLGRPLGPSDVDDVVQEVLARVWDSRASYQGTGTIDAWIGRFCELAFLDELRRRHLRAHTLVDPDALAASCTDAVDERIDLRASSLWLPKREARIVARRVGGDGSFREIGQAVGLGPSATKAAYERALAYLREAVDGRARSGRGGAGASASMSRIAVGTDGSVEVHTGVGPKGNAAER